MQRDTAGIEIQFMMLLSTADMIVTEVRVERFRF